MAISINKYVSIQSYVPSSAAGSASTFNCLLVTPEEMSIESTDEELAKIKAAYDSGLIVTPTKGQASLLFSASSDTAKFIAGYNGYVSPSNVSTTELMLFKMTAADEGKPFAAFQRANNQISVFTGLTFLPPSGTGESSVGSDWFEGLESVAAALGNGRILVVNYKANDDPDDAVTASLALTTNAPVVMIYGANNWSGFAPLAAIGSTVYSAGMSTSLMYRQFADDPAVFDNITANKLDANFINYIGVTQSNGQKIAFLQRGYNLDGTDTTIFLNEMWFRSQCESALINRLAGGTPIPYSATGVYMVSDIVAGIADQAVTNGIFLKTEASDEEIAVVQSMMAQVGDTVEADAISYALAVNGYYLYTYLSRSNGEPSIAYIIAYGSGASVKFIQGTDYVVR